MGKLQVVYITRKGGVMKYKVFALATLLSVTVSVTVCNAKNAKFKHLIQKRRQPRQLQITQQNTRERSQDVRELSMERVLERERQMTKCLDISKIAATIIGAIVSIILASTR